MEWSKARGLLRSLFSRDDPAEALSRRDMLAGIGLVGLFVTAPKLLASSPAHAKAINTPSAEPADATNSKIDEDSAAECKAEDNADDVTDLSGQYRRYRVYRRRYWRRRYRWRRRYWRRRYRWHRRYLRRRYWRRRYWYRRYW
jgi:hypothetical protein